MKSRLSQFISTVAGTSRLTDRKDVQLRALTLTLTLTLLTIVPGEDPAHQVPVLLQAMSAEYGWCVQESTQILYKLWFLISFKNSKSNTQELCPSRGMTCGQGSSFGREVMNCLPQSRNMSALIHQVSDTLTSMLLGA